MRKIALGIAGLIVTAAIIVVILIGGNPNSIGKEIKIAYISKQLTNSWFQQVSGGISSTCKKLGMNYTAYDADYDDEKCLQYVDDAIAWGADAILICTTNQDFGPQIAEKCKRAGVLIVTIDDTMWGGDGIQLPHIGMATTELCTMGGTTLVKMARERAFFDGKMDVKVIQIDVPHLSVIGERLVGYREALISQSQLNEEDFLTINSSTGMIAENLPAVKAELEGNSVHETRWIITGVNDESALAPLYVLREMGVAEENIIACGLGLSSVHEVVKEFQNGNRNYISIAAQPELEGQIAAEMVYEKIVNGIDLKSTTVIGGQIITSDNYKIFIKE